MKNSHNLIIYAIPLLEKMGYKKEDIREVHRDGEINYPRPDYIISGGIAVEVGALSKKDKIKDLLKKYNKVIWIFADQEFPFLNCIIYGTRKFTEKEKLRLLKEKHSDEIKTLTRRIVSLENQRKTFENGVKIIKEIIYEDDYNYGNGYNKYDLKKTFTEKGDVDDIYKYDN